MSQILNLSAYRFVPLLDPAHWRERVLAQAQSRDLRGTVLLATEGINLFLAGEQAPVRDFWGWLTSEEPFAHWHAKESWSQRVPFKRLRVKVKTEIIRMNEPAIAPASGRAAAVDALTLSRWLDAGVDDAGRALVMLDTRNAFEVDQGRFRGACDWRLNKFSDFTQALQTHARALHGKTVVTYCTGGIRCEKAALLMQRIGLKDVLQLDGGILKYFELAGGRHFEGDCFVFDERVALDDTLRPATAPHTALHTAPDIASPTQSPAA